VDRGFLDTSGAHLAATLVEALLDAGRVEEARRTVATWLPRAGAGRERWWLEALGARAALLAGDWTAARRGLAELDRGAREDGLPASTAEAAAVLRCEVAAVELGDEVVAGLAVRTAQRLRGVAPVAALDLLVLAASRRGASRSIGRGDAAEEVWADVRLRVHPVVEEPWRLLADAWRCPPGSPEGVAAWDAALDATRTRIPVARRVDALLAAAGDAVAAGRAARAGRLLAAAADLVDRCGLGLYSSRVDELRASLVPAPSAAWERLSPREMHVLRGLASGASNEQLGRDLTISVRTVEVHVAHLLRKLGATSRGGAVAAAVRRGLVDEDDLRAAGS
jgi:DNA-binding CsgD family transcriptional regulator